MSILFKNGTYLRINVSYLDFEATVCGRVGVKDAIDAGFTYFGIYSTDIYLMFCGCSRGDYRLKSHSYG